MPIRNPILHNPFAGIPNPDWEYSTPWEQLRDSTQNLHDTARLLSAQAQGDQEAVSQVITKLEAAHLLIEQALKTLREQQH